MAKTTFQISRCWYLIKKELVSNKKRIYNYLYLFFIMLVCGPTLNNLLHPRESLVSNNTFNTIIYFIMIFMVIIYITEKNFSISNTKKKIIYLMIPASSFEKYISAFATNLIYIAYCVILVIFSELLRIGLCTLFYPEFGVMFLNPFLFFSNLEAHDIPVINAIISYSLLFISCVLVCTTCKKHTFLYAVGYFLVSFFVFILYFLYLTNTSFSDYSLYNNSCHASILYLLVIVNIVFSYFRFKKLQIV